MQKRHLTPPVLSVVEEWMRSYPDTPKSPARKVKTSFGYLSHLFAVAFATTNVARRRWYQAHRPSQKKLWFPVYTQTVEQSLQRILTLKEIFQKLWFLVTKKNLLVCGQKAKLQTEKAMFLKKKTHVPVEKAVVLRR